MATDVGMNPAHHSARKHFVQKLSNSNIAPTDIMVMSGNKNVSVINYSKISDERQIACSNLLASL